jgi:STE24 endopeptidase
MVFYELPWTPLYTQSGGSAAASSEELSSFGFYALAATVAFTGWVYAFEGSLDSRQKAAYEKTEFPKQLAMTVSKIDVERKKKHNDDKDEEDFKPLLEQLQSKFVKAQGYGLDKINFGMIASSYDTFESIAFLLLGFMPYMWDVSVKIGEKHFEWTTAEHEIYITLVFLLVVTIVGTFTALPFELYSTFQIEKKHGFNKQTYALFFTDKIKSLVLTCAIGGPFIALLLKIIKVSSIRRNRLAVHNCTTRCVISHILLFIFTIDGRRTLLHLRLGVHVFLFGLYDDHCARRHHADVQQV